MVWSLFSSVFVFLWVSSFNWSRLRLKVCWLLRAFWAHIQCFRLRLNRERWKHRIIVSDCCLLVVSSMAIWIFVVTIWHALFLAFVLSSFSAFCFVFRRGRFISAILFVSGLLLSYCWLWLAVLFARWNRAVPFWSLPLQSAINWSSQHWFSSCKWCG